MSEAQRRSDTASRRQADQSPRAMAASVVTMAEIVMPNDANPHGTLSGGRLMHWIDIAGAMSAMRHSRGPVVTVAIDEVEFHEPVPVGHMIHLEATVSCSGRTSVEVRVLVSDESPLTGEERHTTTAHLVFVAIDAEGTPRPVPEVLAETPEEEALRARALERRERRLARREERREG